MRALAFALSLLLPGLASSANWPSWRGPTHDGVTTETDLPLTWSATSANVHWQAPLPDRGNSTPVIWGNKIFVTQSIKGENKRAVLCLDKASGKLLWQSGVTYTEQETTHATNPPCSSSPVTDGERVIAFFGSAGLYCYDMEGNELWKRVDLGPQHQIWGNGASPVLDGDRVYLNFGPGDPTFLLCVDKKTGANLWRHDEPGGSSGEKGGATWIGSWGDPVAQKVGDHEELFMAYPNRVCAFAPATGAELWSSEGINGLVYNSPLYADGIVVAMGGYNGAALAVKAGGHGDVSASQRVWQLPKVSQRIGSGVLYDGYFYIVTDGGIAECRDLKNGQVVYQERLKGPGPKSQNWSSLVRSGDRLYAINQGGDAFVFRAAPKFELLATNSIGEQVIGSMAVSDGQIFIRSYQHLWCIGK